MGTKRTRAELGDIFITGVAPTEGNFDDLFASFISFNDTDINSLTEKVTPHNDDELIIEDSEASYAKKKVKVSSLGGGGGSGESNTLAIHPSATGSSIVETKSGTELRIKGLTSSTGKVTFATSGNDLNLGVNLASSDVSLGNVTNHAQLRVEAGYFQTLTEKTGVLSSDVLIIESPADSDAKRYATFSNLPLLPKYPTITAKAAAFTAAASDHNKIFECTTTFTITLPDVTTVGVGFVIKNVGTGIITLSGSGTLSHSGTKLNNKHDAVYVYHQGSGNWGAIGKLGT